MKALETQYGVHVNQNLQALFANVIGLTASGLESLLPSIVKFVGARVATIYPTAK